MKLHGTAVVCYTLQEGIRHFETSETIMEILVFGSSVDEGRQGTLAVEILFTNASRTRKMQILSAMGSGIYVSPLSRYGNCTQIIQLK